MSPRERFEAIRSLQPDPRMVFVVVGLGALVVGLAIGKLGITYGLYLLVVLTLAIVVALRHDAVTAALIVATSVMIDTYQLVESPIHVAFLGTFTAMALVGLVFLTQSAERPWVSIPMLRVWIVLLALAAIPATRAVSVSDGAGYYIRTFLTPFVMCVLGIQVARNFEAVRQLLSWMVGFGTLAAVQSIVFATTGVFLLATPRLNDYLASANDFRVAQTYLLRAGSFLGNPDWNGALLAFILIIALGLLLSSPSWRGRILYGIAVLVIATATLLTYSVASWIALGGGLVVFVFLSGGLRYGLALVGAAVMAAAAAIVAFPGQAKVLVARASDPSTSSLRMGAWQTAIQVIIHNPLFGLGLGLNTYLRRAEPYRVAAQTKALAHPHNSYLELAALAGLPVFLVFLWLLGGYTWRALRVWRKAGSQYRPLVGGAIAAIAVLSINSLAVNAWTLAPLAMLGWLVLSAIASPALLPARAQQPSSAAAADPKARAPVAASVAAPARTVPITSQARRSTRG